MHRRNASASVVSTMAALVLLGLSHPARSAPVTQTTAPAGSQSYGDWAWQQLGSVTLVRGTDTVLALTSTVTLADQGWGGQDPDDNQVIVGLFDNGTEIWGRHVAGAYHQQTTQSYDVTTSPDTLQALDTALAGVDWSAAPNVTVQMEAVPVGYPGWQLDTENASFSITSDVVPVPEPSETAVFAAALATLAFTARRIRR